MRKILILLFVFLISFTVIGCKKGKKNVSFNDLPSKLSIEDKVNVKINYENVTSKNVKYSSSNNNVVTVDNNGVIEAIGEGNAKVTVTVTDDKNKEWIKEYNFNVVDERTYIIDLILDGATCEVQNDIVKYGESYTLPIPKKDGFEFLGWKIQLDSSEYVTVLENITSDINVYACFAKKSYSITYVLNGGTYEGVDFIDDGAVVELGTPSKKGYKFLGWSLSSTGSNYITELKNIKTNVTVYAKWELIQPKRYSITYVLDGGSYNGPTTIVEGGTLNLDIPTKEEYTFLGWSLKSGSTDYITKIEDVKANITVYANWTEQIGGPFKVTFNMNGGSMVYASYADIVKDFLADMTKVCGKTINGSNFEDNVRQAQFSSFIKNDAMWAKWSWLFVFMKENEPHSAASTIYNEVLNSRSCNSDSFWFLTRDFSGFVNSKVGNFFYSLNPMDFTVISLRDSVWKYMPQTVVESYPEGSNDLPTPSRLYYNFTGWYKDAALTDGPYTKADKKCTLYAGWTEGVKVENIEIVNPISSIPVYNSLQLIWNILPSDAQIKGVSFTSSDKNIATVTDEGFIQTLNTGTVTITIKSVSSSGKEVKMTFKVYKPDHFEISYETNSYVEVGEAIKLNAVYVKADESASTIIWTSKNTDIAKVDENGGVTGLKEGVATITATDKETSKSIDFVVTVVSKTMSDALRYILDSHNSNAKIVYNLGIGSGTPVYYYDIVGGVSDLFFDDFKVDTTYYDKLALNQKNNGLMKSVEFVTVHYTGNMNATADADNNADYFNNLDYAASIHYVTGRTNLSKYVGDAKQYKKDAYYAFAVLNEKYAGWHASDSSKGNHEWIKTGVKVSSTDPTKPLISISSNSYFTINGKETTYKIPDHPYGCKVTGPTFNYNGMVCKSINDQGIAYKIIDGEYYLGNVWWGTQQAGCTLSNIGGNYNSIGIESCVDMGSDLMHTWHVTAQLVASLMVKYNLDISRVVGHHFFSGKDCPQPMLANNQELWYEFIDMVEAEYEKLTNFNNASISLEVVDGQGILEHNGLLKQDGDAHVVTYKVNVVINGRTEFITLGTAVNSMFSCDCNRSYASLQIKGYEVI